MSKLYDINQIYVAIERNYKTIEGNYNILNLNLYFCYNCDISNLFTLSNIKHWTTRIQHSFQKWVKILSLINLTSVRPMTFRKLNNHPPKPSPKYPPLPKPNKVLTLSSSIPNLLSKHLISSKFYPQSPKLNSSLRASIQPTNLSIKKPPLTNRKQSKDAWSFSSWTCTERQRNLNQ